MDISHFTYDGTKWLISGFAAPAAQATITKPVQKFIIVADQKASGSAGGTFTSGAWRTRGLNTIITDPQGFIALGAVALAANQITLAAALWLIEASAPALDVDGHNHRWLHFAAHGSANQNTSARGNHSDQFKIAF